MSKRALKGPGADPVTPGDEFDPSLTRSHKREVSGRETTPEISIDGWLREGVEAAADAEGRS